MKVWQLLKFYTKYIIIVITFGLPKRFILWNSEGKPSEQLQGGKAMLRQVFVNGDFEDREFVKDHFGMWICEGMYVVEALHIPQRRQGWVTEVIDENDGVGKIKVQVVRKAGEILDEQFFYVTEPEPGNNWCKALVDG